MTDEEKATYERMLHALDKCGDDYFRGFGITRESWLNWRNGGNGTYSGGALMRKSPRG
jgi:hypothetical protein